MSSNLDLNHTLYFVTVVEYGSYTKAAERLAVPKSTLSRSIQALEASIDLRLLNRSTRKLSLTKAGEEYYKTCLPIIQELNKAQAQILDYQQDIQGELKITMPNEVGTGFLAKILPEFMGRYPKIKLEIDFSTENHDLVKEGFDLAIRVGQQLSDSSYIAKRIGTPQLGLFASPSYLESQPSIHQLEDLKQHSHLLISMTNGYLPIQNQEPFLRENYQLSSNSMTFNKSLCINGMGIALIPKILCHKEISEAKLIQVLPKLPIERPHIYAIYPSRNHRSKALTALVDFIQTELKKQEFVDK